VVVYLGYFSVCSFKFTSCLLVVYKCIEGYL